MEATIFPANEAPAPPKDPTQPSRKTKKAWRKNVDISEVTGGLDKARDEIRQTGSHTFADLPSEALFQTDTTGSARSKEQWAKVPHTPLKADEIVGARSKVPAIGTRRRACGEVTNGSIPSKRKKGGVSRAELERLKKFAYTDGKATEGDIVQQAQGATYDPWAEAAGPGNPPHSLSFIEPPKSWREPVTLRRAPSAMTKSGKPAPNLRRPASGRSYNPSFPEWQTLVDRAGEKEISSEKERQEKMEKEKEHEARAEDVARQLERLERDAAEAGISDYESEWEGFQSEIDEEGSRTLIAKRPPQRKTPAERNRVIRRKKAEAWERHEAKGREKEKQERRIEEIKKEMERIRRDQSLREWEGFESEAESLDDFEAEENVLKRKRRSRTSIPYAPLDLLLEDDLQDSLRRLKPEGNLLRDRFRNLIIQGKMEARRPVVQPKKPRRDVTEKWTYKDWKLPGSETMKA